MLMLCFALLFFALRAGVEGGGSPLAAAPFLKYNMNII